jgi:putative ATP-dependent endonuclease of OLD family
VSLRWTLEHDISLGELKHEFYTAVLRAEKVQNSNQIGLTEEKCNAEEKQVAIDFDGWAAKSDQEIALKIYEETLLGKDISKAIVAQCFVDVLREQNRENPETLKNKIIADKYVKYLVDAIEYACGE